LQTSQDFEVIVTDNSRGPAAVAQQKITEQYGPRFRYMNTGAVARDCYESANFGAGQASGEYLCFPSDDGYYAPRFLELMLRHGSLYDLIYCDCIWDGRGYGAGEELIHLVTEPRRGKIDKGGFLVARDAFIKAGRFLGPYGIDRAEDGRLIEHLVANGCRHRKVDITGWIHN